MSTHNHVFLVGNITHELENKVFNGRSFVSFQIAVQNIWKDKEGQTKSSTSFIGVTAWGKKADEMLAYYSAPYRTRPHFDVSIATVIG